MCKVGDIILIKDYEKDGSTMRQHSFVVLNDEGGDIQGLNFDLVCNVMSSFKSESQKAKKLSYPGNFPVSNDQLNVKNGNDKDGYIKAEQFYYFKKDKINFVHIGQLEEEVFNLLIDFITGLDIPIEHISENL